jgi:hypothetical protein
MGGGAGHGIHNSVSGLPGAFSDVQSVANVTLRMIGYADVVARVPLTPELASAARARLPVSAARCFAGAGESSATGFCRSVLRRRGGRTRTPRALRRRVPLTAQTVLALRDRGRGARLPVSAVRCFAGAVGERVRRGRCAVGSPLAAQTVLALRDHGRGACSSGGVSPPRLVGALAELADEGGPTAWAPAVASGDALL